jgi:hypothetical protein
VTAHVATFGRDRFVTRLRAIVDPRTRGAGTADGPGTRRSDR